MANAEKDFALVGFGYETILKGAETETHQLNNFLKKRRQLVFKICLFLVRGPSVWRFAFDTEQTPTEAWGELEGWFYLPSILFTFQVHVFMER